MRIYSNLNAVLNALDQLSWEGTLFTNEKTWRAFPCDARFIYLEGDDELEDIVDESTALPRLAQENDVRYFLDVQVFKDVCAKQIELNKNSDLDDFIHALNHYREYDTFYWIKT